MFKKIITITLVLCMVVSLGVFGMTNVSAETQYSCGGQTNSTLTYVEQSQYCVLIPETIDMNIGSYTFEADNMNLIETEHVYVKLQEIANEPYLMCTHTNGTDQTCRKVTRTDTVYNSKVTESVPTDCVGYFSDGDTQSEVTFGLEWLQSDTQPKAGVYSSNVVFEIYLA